MSTILVTGTNRGLGLEFATRYLAQGHRVIATVRDAGKADALLALQRTHGALKIMELDVQSAKSMSDLVRDLDHEAIDILINNAGVYGPRDAGFGKVGAREWLDVFTVNTIAPLLLTQMLIGNLRLGRERKLVFITSKMGSMADNRSGGSYIYRSSKSALNQVARSLAADLAKENFVTAVLHPGWVLTDMGGPNAQIDAATSVRGMMNVIAGLVPGQSGRFLDYDGREIPW